MHFLSDFFDFGSIWGGPGSSKNCSKIEKIGFGAYLERVACYMVVSGRLWVALGEVFGRFWEGLGMIFGRILTGFFNYFESSWGYEQ